MKIRNVTTEQLTQAETNVVNFIHVFNQQNKTVMLMYEHERDICEEAVYKQILLDKTLEIFFDNVSDRYGTFFSADTVYNLLAQFSIKHYAEVAQFLPEASEEVEENE